MSKFWGGKTGHTGNTVDFSIIWDLVGSCDFH